ncbi:hypothetical protein B296_00026106 [Ensete ventricosum]|uniref:Uncharacterized protein n=1 Tax=Ensete ventricosum TaxID=4639 RepID=A0A426XMP9_ENSVE|nr:hypothetical protein B296_00026106 [Ensete ventricosum]
MGGLPTVLGSLSAVSRWPSLVIYGAWMAVEGAVGLGMASRGAILVLHTLWFNHSSWIRMKEIVAPLLLLKSLALGPQ